MVLLVAFSDNSAIVEGIYGSCFYPNINGMYEKTNINPHIVVKAETHNHPTAISPFSGAATGNGGEIRDEAAADAAGLVAPVFAVLPSLVFLCHSVATCPRRLRPNTLLPLCRL